jgi:transaldolase
MKIFIDSADIAEIKDAASLGVVDGVTTNPSLVAKTGKPIERVIREICAVVDGPISAEVLATDTSGILREARELAAIHPNVVIKVPLIAEGLRAIKALKSEGIASNATLCFSAPQALLAAKAGARYISPFLGRIDDVGGDGLELVSQILTIYRNYDYSTEVLAASIRHPVHLVRCAKMGTDVCTIPYKVILHLLNHPLTDIGLAKFLEDAKKIPQTTAGENK